VEFMVVPLSSTARNNRRTNMPRFLPLLNTSV
jgi:hypothetical protein